MGSTGNISIITNPVATNMISTGSIVLRSQNTVELFNECHGEADGRFCGGPGGAGRVRDIKNKDKKKKVQGDIARQQARNKQMGDISDALTIAYAVAVVAIVVAPVVVPLAQAKLKERQINKKVAQEVADGVRDKSAKWATIAGTGKRGKFFPGSSKRAFRKLGGEEAKSVISKLSAGEGASAVDKVAWKNANSVYEIEAGDGTKLFLVDQRGKASIFGRLSGKATRKHKEILNSMAFAHETSPLKNTPVAVLSTDAEAFGWTMGAKGHKSIFINPDFIDDSGITPSQFVSPGWNMPASKKVSHTHYTVMHEYGHRFDFENDRGNAAHLFDRPKVKRHLSGYANSKHIIRGEQPWEGYAESYADWHGSSGTSRNPSTLTYANDQGWFGTKAAGSVFNPSDGKRYVRTPEGAQRFGIPIGSVIPEGIIDELKVTGTITMTSKEVSNG